MLVVKHEQKGAGPMRVIDLRSDTVTLPGEEMRAAMAKALIIPPFREEENWSCAGNSLYVFKEYIIRQ